MLASSNQGNRLFGQVLPSSSYNKRKKKSIPLRGLGKLHSVNVRALLPTNSAWISQLIEFLGKLNSIYFSNLASSLTHSALNVGIEHFLKNDN